MNGLIEMSRNLIEQFGYTGIFWLTTTEQFIQPIPSDIFIAAGTATGLNLSRIVIVVSVAAILGALIGYGLGRYLGHPVATWLFGKKNIQKGEDIMSKWGFWAVFVAALTPIPFKVFTWLSGIFEMRLSTYLLAVVLGRIPRYLITAYGTYFFVETKFYATESMSAIILGALQGVTEFLPISSSGHLAIMERFLNLPVTQSNMELFDIFLHGGSLLAIVIFFWRDWVNVLKEVWGILTKWRWTRDLLTSKLIVGIIPAIIAGVAFADVISSNLRSLRYVASAFLFVGVFFLYAEWKGRRASKSNVTIKRAAWIGIAQAFALIPGISRAGSTIGTGLILGIKRDAAAKFSFMLGAVTILAANAYALLSISSESTLPGLSFTLIGFFTSFVVSIASITWLMRYLKKHTLNVFAVYLMILGGVLLSLF